MPTVDTLKPMAIGPLAHFLNELEERFGLPTHVRASYAVGDVYIEIAMQRIPKEATDESDDEE